LNGRKWRFRALQFYISRKANKGAQVAYSQNAHYKLNKLIHIGIYVYRLSFLANVNSCPRSFTFAVCHRPSVCRLSVTFVHPTQAIEIFGNVYAIWYVGHLLTC